MFKDFLSALTHKISEFLIETPDFLSQNQADRQKKLEKLSLPNSFKEYLSSVKEQDLLQDFELVLNYCKNPKTNVRNNKLFLALKSFLLVDLAGKIDHLDTSYYLMDEEDRKKVADKLINSNSHLANALKQIIIHKTYQQLVNGIQQLADKTAKTPLVVIQSPREMDHNKKRDIREHLQKDQVSLPIFQINKKLIGGIRIFIDGQTSDNSWLSRVHKFTSLTAA